jgi:ATP-binding cassette subfamily C protein
VRALATAARGLLGPVLAFSALVNLLMLTGPLFMLQVYERVLPSRSAASLYALFGLVGFLYAAMVVLDHARARLVARLGARLARQLEGPVFEAAQRLQQRRPGDPLARAAPGDLDTLQRWLASPVFLALFDAPWVPAYMALIFLFHPLLGWLAVAGAAALLGLAVLNQVVVRGRLAAAADHARAAERLGEALGAEAGTLAALGMERAAFARWAALRGQALVATIDGSDRAAFFAAASRGLRLFLQSAMLAAGAWLVLAGQLGPGAMIAASIILGRALAPVEQAVGQWGSVQAARLGWHRLGLLLAGWREAPARLALPRPAGMLSAQDLVVMPPGERRASLREVSLQVAPGQCLGVIGPSGAGKSTLARALVGAWPLAAGAVRLDGLALEAWDPEVLGAAIGYLPQRVVLFDGTVADNIARLQPGADPQAVIEAARAAGAHEMILSLPRGYDTPVTGGGSVLSGGQVQRIGLARALYGAPAVVVLDEPDAHLDGAGMAALGAALRALKARGAAVVVVAHRAAALAACDEVLALDGGRVVAQGPRERVLREARLPGGLPVPVPAGQGAGAE